MKRAILLFVFVMLSLSACSSDEGGVVPQSDQLTSMQSEIRKVCDWLGQRGLVKPSGGVSETFARNKGGTAQLLIGGNCASKPYIGFAYESDEGPGTNRKVTSRLGLGYPDSDKGQISWIRGSYNGLEFDRKAQGAFSKVVVETGDVLSGEGLFEARVLIVKFEYEAEVQDSQRRLSAEFVLSDYLSAGSNKRTAALGQNFVDEGNAPNPAPFNFSLVSDD